MNIFTKEILKHLQPVNVGHKPQQLTQHRYEKSAPHHVFTRHNTCECNSQFPKLQQQRRRWRPICCTRLNHDTTNAIVTEQKGHKKKQATYLYYCRREKTERLDQVVLDRTRRRSEDLGRDSKCSKSWWTMEGQLLLFFIYAHPTSISIYTGILFYVCDPIMDKRYNGNFR